MNKPISGENLEIEVKFLIRDIGKTRRALMRLGAVQESPRTYEKNIVFDNPWHGLARQGKLLRLRQDAGARITFKGQSPLQLGSEVRVREEIEVDVGDFDKTAAILTKIGFEKQVVYEKYRETFSLRNIEVVLDEMPFGDFLELEGSEDGIRSAADALHLQWENRLIDNYLALDARIKRRYELAFDDITFENYEAVKTLDAEAVLLGTT